MKIKESLLPIAVGTAFAAGIGSMVVETRQDIDIKNDAEQVFGQSVITSLYEAGVLDRLVQPNGEVIIYYDSSKLPDTNGLVLTGSETKENTQIGKQVNQYIKNREGQPLEIAGVNTHLSSDGAVYASMGVALLGCVVGMANSGTGRRLEPNASPQPSSPISS